MTGLVDRLRHPWVVRGARIAIGLVFLYAALPKIGDAASFAAQVHNFRMLPWGLENLLAITLPWVELVVGLALVTGIRARAGALVATALMAVFLVAVAQAVIRGLDIECGCFGTADATKVGAKKLLENTGLLILAGVAALRPRP